MDLALKEGNYGTVIVFVGINDFINDDSSTKAENSLLNLEKVAIKLKKCGIKSVYLSGLVLTARVHLPLLNQVNKCMFICKAYNISFINDDNVIKNDIYGDGLYLLRSGKFLLLNNFIENVNNFLEIHTHHPHVPIHIPLV